MENLRNSSNKSNNRKGIFFNFTPILAGALFFMNPNGANAQNNTSSENRTQAEISTSTILDRLNQKLGISLPDEYNDKVLDFVLNDTIMNTRSATSYTEDFITNEMQKDRGIDKQNQLLFIRSKIYGGISKKKLYNRLDDENESRSAEYKRALKQIATCYEEYKKGFKTYMEMGIAEADRRSAEAKEQAMKLDSLGLKEIHRFYTNFKKNPDIITESEIQQATKVAKDVIQNCKKYGIDYRAILLKEVGDMKKVDAILKFYDVE